MTIHSIYNKALETNPTFEPLTTRDMTPEEMVRVYGEVFEPARDTGGKELKPLPFTPFKTSNNGAPRAGKTDKERKPRRLTIAPHVDKFFIQMWLSKGKTLETIAAENGIPLPSMRDRAKTYGLYSPKAYSNRRRHGR